MLLEATLALLGLMGFTWATAIWASYHEPQKPQLERMRVDSLARKAA